MVLNKVYLGLCIVTSLLFLPFQQQEGELLRNYKKQIDADIKKALKEDSFSYNMVDLSFHNLEVYSVTADKKIKGYLFVKEVKACSLVGCQPKTNTQNELGSEYYDLAIFANNKQQIVSIRVLDYFSDYGYEISSKSYLKKYKGMELCSFRQSKTRVDGISGATISYNALLTSLEEFCAILD